MRQQRHVHLQPVGCWAMARCSMGAALLLPRAGISRMGMERSRLLLQAALPPADAGSAGRRGAQPRLCILMAQWCLGLGLNRPIRVDGASGGVVGCRWFGTGPCQLGTVTTDGGHVHGSRGWGMVRTAGGNGTDTRPFGTGLIIEGHIIDRLPCSLAES